MSQATETYTHTVTTPIYNSVDKVPLGTCIIDYVITRSDNLSGMDQTLAYRVFVKQRVIFNGVLIDYFPFNSVTLGYNFPAMLSSTVSIVDTHNTDANIVIENAFPKTINTTVNTSSNQSDGSSVTSNTQVSRGSTTSNTNSFGTSFTLSILSDSLSGSHSSTSGKSVVVSHDEGTGSSVTSSSSNSMSVKDWSCVSTSNFNENSVQWIWGQTFPWDVFKYSQGATNSGGDVQVTLPDSVQQNMLEPIDPNDESQGNLLLPPSDIAIAGLDFTMYSTFRIEYPDGVTHNPQFSPTCSLGLNYASYYMDDSTSPVQALILAPVDWDSTPIQIDLNKYSLNPLSTGKGGYACVGFNTCPFLITPENSHGYDFLITSPNNTLEITGNGFDNTMAASLSATTTASMQLYFKVLDPAMPLTLMLKHWVAANSGAARITLTFNPDSNQANSSLPPGNQPQKYELMVFDSEGTGPDNNISEIDLRNLDADSINYHDFLKPGMNVIEISIEAANTQVSTDYTLSSVVLS